MGGCLCCCIGDDDRNAERYINELNAYYEEACRLDPEIQTFNVIIRHQTSRVLSSLANDAAAFRSPSFNSLKKATDALFVLNHDAFEAILDLKDDISSNPDLLFFVKEFFKNTVEILKFFDALKHCLRRAHEAESIISSAVKFFDEREFLKSLDKFREFRALGDPFTSEFIKEIRSVCEQERSMLTSLLKRKHEIDRKMTGCVEVWRKVWSIVYAVTFAAVLISSVVLAAVAAPPVAVAAAQAASAPMDTVGEWFNKLWKNCAGVLEEDAKVIGTAGKKTFFAIHDLENIRVAVEQLEVTMRSMAWESKFGTREEEEVALRDEEEAAAVLREAVEKMRKNMQEFGRGVVELEGEVDKCRENAREASTTMLKIITSEA